MTSLPGNLNREKLYAMVMETTTLMIMPLTERNAVFTK